MATLRMMPCPISSLILIALYKAFKWGIICSRTSLERWLNKENVFPLYLGYDIDVWKLYAWQKNISLVQQSLAVCSKYILTHLNALNSDFQNLKWKLKSFTLAKLGSYTPRSKTNHTTYVLLVEYANICLCSKFKNEN